MIAVLKAAYERLLLAEDCRLRCALKRPLSGKLTLKLDESAAIYDPERTLNCCLNQIRITLIIQPNPVFCSSTAI
ncbi:MAG: hypothetical protein ACYTBW_06360 [Planctomycetota bacterium]|jgi:hypothetical protein